MTHKRSVGKLEAKQAREYCYKHSERKQINPYVRLSERVFTGTPSELEQNVLAEIKGERSGAIPEIPQGTVITDIRGACLITNDALGVQ